MAVKTKGAALTVPQTDEEANALLMRYGATVNEIARMGVQLDEDLASVKAQHEEAAKPLQQSLVDMLHALQAYGAAHRRRLTGSGETKTVKMPAGEIGWRTNPPSVKFKRGFKAEDIVAELRKLNLRRFMRSTVTVNKQAMLDDPDTAKTVPGVQIVCNVEEFFVAPFGAELVEPKSE